MNWIPITEQLPTEYMDVLVTYKIKKTARNYVTTATWSHFIDLDTAEIVGPQTFTQMENDNGHVIMTDMTQNKDYKILAWMPFPKPYEDGFRVIVAGSRTFTDYDFLKEKLDKAFAKHKPTSIVCGEAKGADTLGRRYAEEHGIQIDSFQADWVTYGKQAGYIRNEQMADNADAAIVFIHNDSAGSKHMINTAKKQGLQVRVIKV